MKTIKKISIFIVIATVIACFSACSKNADNNQVIKIGVMGNPEDFYPSYQDGIEAALSDVQKEYADTGYTFEVNFFNDESNYEKGMKIADELANDDAYIGVIGSRNMDISNASAHVIDESEKIFVAPYFIFDAVCRDNYYDYVFAMCNSANTTGTLIRKGADQSSAKRWAVCSTTRAFERDELNGFVNHHTDNVEIADCVSINDLSKDFDEIYKRWELLGVEGVAFFVKEDEGKELLKKLKAKNPNLVCAGDTLFDDSDKMDEDPEFLSAMEGFIMADAFCLDYNDETDEKRLDEISEAYKKQKGTGIDYWYIQGYNAVRMIYDTAMKNQTSNPEMIAQKLHDEGYDGLMQNFAFDRQGIQLINPDYYVIYTDANGWDEYSVK